MYSHRNKQKGSLMIEMVAVIGLIALITPILFHQINRRNEEIVDTQIATEMRMLKDAASAYIRANEDWLSKNPYDANGCALWDDTKQEYKSVSNATPNKCGGENAVYDISTFQDYLVSPNGVLDEYDVYFRGYTVETSCYFDEETEKDICEYRPVIYAVIVQATPMKTLRRASKIASLIGLEGGVVVKEGESLILKGMQGVWSLELKGLTEDEDEDEDDAVGVISSFDDASNASILKDVRWQHMQSDTAQADTMAAERLGVKDILTVDDSENCIVNYGNGTLYIQKTGDGAEGDMCLPFFEVNPETKEVRIVGDLVMGGGVIKTAEYAPADPSECEQIKDEDSCKENSACGWIGGKCLPEYQLDPKYTSVMNDIKLTSRGGARLSEILPKWSLVGVELLETVTPENGMYPVEYDETQDIYEVTLTWNCPIGYTKGAIIIPTVFALPAGRVSNVSGTTATLASDFQFIVTAAPYDPNITDAGTSMKISIGKAIQAAVVQKYCVWVDSQSIKDATDPALPETNRPDPDSTTQTE